MFEKLIGAKEKCEQYWPDPQQKTKQYRRVSITNVKETKKSADLIERDLEVASLESGKQEYKNSELK